MIALYTALLIFFTGASAFFSLALISLFSLTTTEIKLFKQDRNLRKRQVAHLLAQPRDLLVTLMFYDIGANIFVQNTAANLFGTLSSWVLTVGVPLVLTLLLGEILPKTIALPNNVTIAYRIAPIIDRLQKILHPLLHFMTSLTAHISSFLFFFLKKEKEISNEELHHVLKSSKKYGILNQEELKLVDGYLALTDYTIKERMIPRHAILSYDTEDSLSKLTHIFVDLGCTRIPVCQDDLQNLLGILTAPTFFLHRHEIDAGKNCIPFLQKPCYVPETISARTLLSQFLKQEERMGIVIDEYGFISGLITLEDLFEVVVGEITDRRDEKIRYTSAGKNVIITSGKFEIAEFEELFHVSLPSKNITTTLGGWLTEQLGDIPKSGTKYTWNGFLFHVLAADPNRVRRVYIRRLKNE